MPTILLLDNGSTRPEATLALRRVAQALTEVLGQTVHPVSLQHSARIPGHLLDGRPANTLEPFLHERRRLGEREFLGLPLFFGPSRALSSFVPDTVARVAAAAGPMQLSMADVLCPLPEGESRLVDILQAHVRSALADAGTALAGGEPTSGHRRVVLVDHGSPIAEVTAVRRWLAQQLAHRLAASGTVVEAVMERRAGAAYDFNGALLEDVLEGFGAPTTAPAIGYTGPGRTFGHAAHGSDVAGGSKDTDPDDFSWGVGEGDWDRADLATVGPVVLAMQFIAPGRHAGAGGDIEQICERALERYPGLRILRTPLVGEHPALVDILVARALRALARG